MLLRTNIYDALRSAILACDLPPGRELREHDLAAQYGVSRSPIRDALLRLETDRLVTVLPRQGYRVTTIERGDAADIFGLRLVLEPAAAALAAQRLCDAASQSAGRRWQSPVEAERLARDVNRLEALRDPGGEDFFVYNRRFHAAVAELSGTTRMAAIIRDLVAQSDRLVRVSLHTPINRAALIAEHVAIIDAVRQGQAAGVEALMRAHVAEARDRVLAALPREESGQRE